MRVVTVFPNHCSGGHVSHACLSLCDHVNGGGVDLTLWCLTSDAEGRRAYARDAVPRFLKPLSYRFDKSETALRAILSRRVLRFLRPGDVVWVWATVSPDFVRALKGRGYIVVWEQIGLAPTQARRISNAVFERFGFQSRPDWSDEIVRSEIEIRDMVDYIFTPSTFVGESLMDEGVTKDKLIPTSYGWDPERIARHLPSPWADEQFTVLFVGRVTLDKGAHILLDAWSRAGVPGRLVLLGKVSPEIENLCGEIFARDDVFSVVRVDEIAPYFQSADLFVLPTLHEGSPLVNYEALGAGLPIITTPMGAGEVVRDGVEGLVVEADDQDGWVDALRKLAEDRDLLRTMGDAAKARGEEFTWEKVGERRRDQLRALASSESLTSKQLGRV